MVWQWILLLRWRSISVGAQQRVEILKTLYRGADILIFDEPTAVLTPSEIDELIGNHEKPCQRREVYHFDYP